MTYYLDASVIVPLFVDEPMTAGVAAWLSAQDGVPIVSRLAIRRNGIGDLPAISQR